MVPYTKLEPFDDRHRHRRSERGMSPWRPFRFSGADSRIDWWGSQVLILLIYVFGGAAVKGTSNGYGALFFLLCVVACAYLSFASGTRRLHDRGKSGLWMLLAFIPLGNIWLFIELGFLPGDRA